MGQLTRAFNGLVARLRAALQTQRQFMADASHELRSPVSVIRTTADVALSREHRDESEYREALAMTGAQSRRLGALVDDMLVLARADAGGYPLRPVDFYLDDVVDDCRRAVSVLAAERHITVASSGASEVPLRGDEELLRRLLVNLLQNAVQHTPPGGAVSVDVTPERSNVNIRVTDTGSGIAGADQGAHLRTLRAARSVAALGGRRARADDREMDRRSARRIPDGRVERTPGQHLLRVSSGRRPRGVDRQDVALDAGCG